MSAAADTAREPLPELLLACGHRLADVRVTARGSVCGACEDALRSSETAEAEMVGDESPRERAHARGFHLEASPAADPERPAGQPQDEPETTETHAAHSPAAIEADDESEVLEGEIEATPPISQPVHATLAAAPGPRGCWATKRDGTACAARARNDTGFCNAHSGVGVSADPVKAGRLATQARQRESERRARLTLALGDARATSIRGQMRLMAAEKGSRVAGRVLDAILDENADPIQAARLGLQLIDAVEPVAKLDVSLGLPSDPAALDGLSLSELQALALASGVEVPPALPA